MTENRFLRYAIPTILVVSVLVIFNAEKVSEIDLGTGLMRKRTQWGWLVLSQSTDDTFADIVGTPIEGTAPTQWKMMSSQKLVTFPLLLGITHIDYVYGGSRV